MTCGNEKQLILNDGSDGEPEDVELEEPVDASSPNSLVAEDGDSHDEDSQELWGEFHQYFIKGVAEEDASSLKSEVVSMSLEIEEPKTEPETVALTGPQTDEEIGVGDGITDAENVGGNGDNGLKENEIGNEEEKEEEEKEDIDVEIKEEKNDIDVEIEEKKVDIDLDNDKENEKENTDMEMKDEKKEDTDLDNDKANEEEKIADENRGKRKDYADKADNEPTLKKQKTEDAPSNAKDKNNDPEKASSLSPNLHLSTFSFSNVQ